MLSIKFVKSTKPTWLRLKGVKDKSPIEYQIMVNDVRVGIIWRLESASCAEYIVWWKLSAKTPYPRDMKFIFSLPAPRNNGLVRTPQEERVLGIVKSRARKDIRRQISQITELAGCLASTEKNHAYVEAAVFDAESGHLALLPTAPVLKPGQKLFAEVPR